MTISKDTKTLLGVFSDWVIGGYTRRHGFGKPIFIFGVGVTFVWGVPDFLPFLFGAVFGAVRPSQSGAVRPSHVRHSHRPLVG